MQITEHVYQVGGSTLSHPSDAAIYCVTDGKVTALIDAGTGDGHDRVLKNIAKENIDASTIHYLFLTHCHFDHVGGANKLRGTFNCKVVAHQLDAQYIEAGDQYVTAANWYGSFLTPCTIDIKVNDSEKSFAIGSLTLNMHHIPGHSPGSVALTVESEGKLVLFGQDVHGPLNDVLKSNRDDYIQSLEFLLSLDADILCEGHFGVYFGKEEVKNFIESFL